MARRGTLKKIKKLHSEIVAPMGAKMYGVTPEGRQLYVEERARSKSEPVKDAQGNQRYRKNPMTGEPLYPLRKVKLYTENLIYFLKSQGNGNIGRVIWRPPSPEQIAQAKRAQKVKDMQVQLAEALVDNDIAAGDLLGLLGKKDVDAIEAKTEPRPVPPPPPIDAPSVVTEPEKSTEPAINYPLSVEKGVWELSNGQRFEGNKKGAVQMEKKVAAELAERLADAKANAALTPEE